jgi:phytoene dehydrogenase-like protein
VRDLSLERHGLQVHQADPWIAAPLPQGGRLELWRDLRRSADAIRRLSARDGARWPEFCRRMSRLAGVLQTLYSAPPPDLMARDLGELLRLGALGWRVRRLGREGMTDLLRILPMSVGELLDDWFESDALKGVLGAAGVMHLRQGPRSGGTAFLLLHHHVGNPPGVFRPPRSNIAAVLREVPGVEIRRGAEVARVTVREGKATGVVLATGEEIAAPLVLSGVDPRRTLLEMIDPGWLDPEVARAVGHIRAHPVAARVSLSMNRAPDFTTLAVAPSLDYLERAYDDVKYGRVSMHPYLEARASYHRTEVHMQFAPLTPRERPWDEAGRRALGDLVVNTLVDHAPGLRDAIVERMVVLPGDAGNVHHADMMLDQILFMRPVPACARYRTPVRGLYLCGPGTHPGGGIAGASGAHAARMMLSDRSV